MPIARSSLQSGSSECIGKLLVGLECDSAFGWFGANWHFRLVCGASALSVGWSASAIRLRCRLVCDGTVGSFAVWRRCRMFCRASSAAWCAPAQSVRHRLVEVRRRCRLVWSASALLVGSTARHFRLVGVRRVMALSVGLECISTFGWSTSALSVGLECISTFGWLE
jgi:hypothetical protein